ncbi:MAG: F0F1 ATP synthase subunit alpha [Eubacteriales bacterium]|nr:F0F1 ATP synthase subunit alpha [Eubacteriales bacterium]
MTDAKFRIIRIVTAVELDPERGKRIAARFAENFQITDYDLRLETDKGILGGMVIYAGGYRYDYSIKGQLGRIGNQLKAQKSINGNAVLDVNDRINDLIKGNLDDALAKFDEMPIAPGGADIFNEVEPARLDNSDVASKVLIDNLRETLTDVETNTAVDEVGQVERVGDGVAYVTGIENCRNSELIMFGQNAYGIAMNLEETQVGIVLLQQDVPIYEGMICKRTGRTVSVPVGKEMVGRVVDALGVPIDGMGSIQTSSRRPIEAQGPGVVDRQAVNVSLHTGITAIDAMIPIGRGQRELIIGDRQTGKTAIAIDTILNQKGKNVYCVYVSIGQKMSTTATIVKTLTDRGAMDYTTVVVASAGSSAAMQYIAPYSGCAIAEELMYNDHADVLIVYDDLSKHAQAYRAISLLLRRPPGREAYPGDVFYLHSRLLERAARLNDPLGGGSITALPIVETLSGDISAYIPTNVISITDGQIYLESELFYSGVRPAVNVGLSVSRVGGSAQSKAMKKVAGPMRINLAQYRELEAFSQFGSELDEDTRRQLNIGERVIEVLKQSQYSPIDMEVQVIMIYLANKGVLVNIDKDNVRDFLNDFVQYVHDHHSNVMEELSTNKIFTDNIGNTLTHAVETFSKIWKPVYED